MVIPKTLKEPLTIPYTYSVKFIVISIFYIYFLVYSNSVLYFNPKTYFFLFEKFQ